MTKARRARPVRGAPGQPRGARPPRRRRRRSVARIRVTSATRLRVGFLLVAMVVSLFAARLLQLQGVDAATYAAKARAVGMVTDLLPATRGAITDRNGVPLAESVDGLMIVADPTQTRDHAHEIAALLTRRLNVPYASVLRSLERGGGVRFRYLARRVPSTLARNTVAAIADHGWKGVYTRRDPLRSYPAEDVGANIVGFMNDQGMAGGGAELFFDQRLRGRDGSETFEVGGGNRIPLGDTSRVDPVDGRNIELTIDRDVQWYMQRVLRDTVVASHGVSGVAVALDVPTGEVLGLADYPTYNPNDTSEARKGDLASRALKDVYEPGSVEKTVTMASLLDARKVTPRTRVSVPSVLTSSDRVIHDWFAHGTLHLTLTGVLAKSSNIGTALAARRFTDQELYDRLRAFGLGSRTGVGGWGESAGVLPDWSGWPQIAHDNIAFGQGLSVNALQMAAAVNVVANGGVYVQPSLVKGEATNNAGEVVGSGTTETRRVIGAAAARKTALMMEAVPDGTRGTAPLAGIEGYRVAGKTGTAQRVGRTCGCYDGSSTLSFVGFAPADAPRFLVYVVVQDGHGSGGGGVGGPAFHKIMSYLLTKYAVPPTGTTGVRLPVYWGPDTKLEQPAGE